MLTQQQELIERLQQLSCKLLAAVVLEKGHNRQQWHLHPVRVILQQQADMPLVAQFALGLHRLAHACLASNHVSICSYNLGALARLAVQTMDPAC